MADQMILAGLKRVVEGGGTLKEAMMSFYNAGYDKKEIEEAAKEYQMQNFSQTNSYGMGSPPVQNNLLPTPKQNTLQNPQQNTQKIPESNPAQNTQQNGLKIPAPNSSPQIPAPNSSSQNPTPFPPPQNKLQALNSQVKPASQKVSAYGQKQKSSSTMWILILLVFILLCLVGVLVASLIFRESIVSFFNKSF